MDSDREILEMVKGSIDAGGAGLSIGRNVFQHKTPQKMVQAMAAIIHDGRSLDDALAILNNA
jgi:class I fructose-bisphosphate aldolase